MKIKSLLKLFTVRNILLCLPLGGILYICVKLGSQISLSQQLEIIKIIRETSTLLFGIIGTWISVLFTLFFTSNKFDSDAKEMLIGKTKSLFIPLARTIYIISFAIIVNIIIPFIRLFHFEVCQIEILRSILLFFTLAFTYWLFLTMVIAIYPFDTAKTKVEIAQENDLVSKQFNDDAK